MTAINRWSFYLCLHTAHIYGYWNGQTSPLLHLRVEESAELAHILQLANKFIHLHLALCYTRQNDRPTTIEIHASNHWEMKESYYMLYNLVIRMPSFRIGFQNSHNQFHRTLSQLLEHPKHNHSVIGAGRPLPTMKHCFCSRLKFYLNYIMIVACEVYPSTWGIGHNF